LFSSARQQDMDMLELFLFRICLELIASDCCPEVCYRISSSGRRPPTSHSCAVFSDPLQ
jgi:hypothetical protein